MKKLAGIGFKLRKMMRKESLILDIAAVLCSVLITSGPWVISSAYLFWILTTFKSVSGFFLGVVTYSFIFSMMIVGAFSFLLMRHLADLLFLKNYKGIFGTYKASLFIVLTISLLASGIFFVVNNQYTSREIILGIYTFLAVSVIWVDVVFLEVVENYLSVIVSFLVGFSSAIMLSFSLKDKPLGLLIAFDFGVLIILFMLSFLLLRSFGTEGKANFELIKAARKYPENPLIGIFYYAAVWIDDLIAWKFFGKEIAPGFYFAKEYDMPMFLAYIFIIPTLVLFVLLIETEFYADYKAFYSNIISNKKLDEIELQHKRLQSSLTYSLRVIWVMQLVVFIIGMLVSPLLSAHIFKSDMATFVFKTGLFGSSMNAIFLTYLLIVLYFDYRKLALRGTLFVFFSNFVISFATMKNFPGVGFAISFSLGVVYFMMHFNIRNLLYITFAKQSSGLEKTTISLKKIGGTRK